jgi:hypothetical protein
MQQATCKLKMTKCHWNVIKSDNSYNVLGWQNDKIFSCYIKWWLKIYGDLNKM